MRVLTIHDSWKQFQRPERKRKVKEAYGSSGVGLILRLTRLQAVSPTLVPRAFHNEGKVSYYYVGSRLLQLRRRSALSSTLGISGSEFISKLHNCQCQQNRNRRHRTPQMFQ